MLLLGYFRPTTIPQPQIKYNVSAKFGTRLFPFSGKTATGKKATKKISTWQEQYLKTPSVSFTARTPKAAPSAAAKPIVTPKAVSKACRSRKPTRSSTLVTGRRTRQKAKNWSTNSVSNRPAPRHTRSFILPRPKNSPRSKSGNPVSKPNWTSPNPMHPLTPKPASASSTSASMPSSAPASSAKWNRNNALTSHCEHFKIKNAFPKCFFCPFPCKCQKKAVTLQPKVAKN